MYVLVNKILELLRFVSSCCFFLYLCHLLHQVGNESDVMRKNPEISVRKIKVEIP